MSEVQSRGSATRGRGGFRGGRGGYRGARGAKPHSKIDDHETNPPLEDQGEVGELKSKYADKLPLLREVAEGWSDEDLVFALQETNGDEAAALDRITSGTSLFFNVSSEIDLTTNRYNLTMGRSEEETAQAQGCCCSSRRFSSWPWTRWLRRSWERSCARERCQGCFCCERRPICLDRPHERHQIRGQNRTRCCD